MYVNIFMTKTMAFGNNNNNIDREKETSFEFPKIGRSTFCLSEAALQLFLETCLPVEQFYM